MLIEFFPSHNFFDGDINLAHLLQISVSNITWCAWTNFTSLEWLCHWWLFWPAYL